jgi:alkylation response protein AidB-like acyl-CoA dehydrogenase
MTGEALETFRGAVQAFLASSLSPELPERVRAGYYLSKDELLGWHRALFRRGWAGGNWPVEYGGAGWSPMQRFVFEEECARFGAPILMTIGLNQVASLLMAYGTDAQKAQHLPRILDGTDVWCQGFSEPEAGSDLASLTCRAERVGDHYVINGAKTWTSLAHWSDWCVLLVRTASGGRKQEGITILLLDMASKGIRVRPIIGIDGMHSLNEMFLDDVRVPLSCRVGEEHQGWALMKVFLGHERLSAAGIWKCKAHFARLCHLAAQPDRFGVAALDRPLFRQRLAWLEIRMQALEVILIGVIGDPGKARGIEAGLLKLRGTEIQQELLAMISELAGPYAIPLHLDVLRNGWKQEPVGPEFAAAATPAYLFWRKATISAGSNEIMRNLIAQEILG